jgi:hypothetical protein
MESDTDKRLDRLFAAARAVTSDSSAFEEHFETRLMARIRERRSEQQPWYALAWRMLPAYAGVMAVIAVCSYSFYPVRSADLFAALTGSQEDTVTISYLAGE